MVLLLPFNDPRKSSGGVCFYHLCVCVCVVCGVCGVCVCVVQQAIL